MFGCILANKDKRKIKVLVILLGQEKGICLKLQLDHFGHYRCSHLCLLPHLLDQQLNALLGFLRILGKTMIDWMVDVVISCKEKILLLQSGH